MSKARSAEDLTLMPRLTCAFGNPSLSCIRNTCRKCRAYADQLEAQFWRHVNLGRFDSEGYTPADRTAQQAKRAAA